MLRHLDIIPLDCHGNPSDIRRYATKFSSLPQAVASTVPNLLTWAILIYRRLRANATGGFSANPGANQDMVADLRQKNMDLTTYTSQLRYRFPAHLHEALAKAQSE